jgi:excisionase family DNA binding protein
MTATSTRRLLLIPEVADILGVSTARAYELARTGALPAVRLGRQVRVDPDALQTWLDNGGQPLSGGWRREAE